MFQGSVFCELCRHLWKERRDMGLSGWELLLIFVVILLLFGAKRLPELARSMGKAVNEFKKAKDEVVSAAAPDTAEKVEGKKDEKGGTDGKGA